MDNNNFENVTNAAEEAVAQAAEPVVEAAETVAQAAEPVVEAAATAAGAEAGSMPVYTDYSSYDNGEEKKGINVLGLVAMILGILSVVLLICGCCLLGGGIVTSIFRYLIIVVRIVMAIVAIILGAIGIKKRPDQKGMAIAGLILGIFGVLLGILSLVFAIIGSVAGAVLGGVSSSPDFQQYLEELQDSLESTY